MDNVLKEYEWKAKRLGRITASELGDVVSLSGKITEANIDYIRHKRFERRHRFVYPVRCANFDIGNEQEPYAIGWLRNHYPELDIKYAQEFDEIPFWTVGWSYFGASPDAFLEDESIGFEIKTLCSIKATEFYADPSVPYEEKESSVLKDHAPQIMGQFLSNEKVKEIWLVKYIYQHDDCDEDRDSPYADWRGLVFKFKREDFDLESLRSRIIMFDQFINSDVDIKTLMKK